MLYSKTKNRFCSTLRIVPFQAEVPFCCVGQPGSHLVGEGVGSDVMKPIAAPLVGGMITSIIHVLILVPVFFAQMKERALRRGTLGVSEEFAGSKN